MTIWTLPLCSSRQSPETINAAPGHFRFGRMFWPLEKQQLKKNDWVQAVASSQNLNQVAEILSVRLEQGHHEVPDFTNGLDLDLFIR